MKRIFFLLIALVFQCANAQEIKEQNITTKVNDVTVFIQEAQITRKKTVNVSSGETILKFTNLSPFIKAQSVKVKAKGAITVLNVSHQQNYLEELAKNEDLVLLEKELEDTKEKLELENTYYEILKEELEFLRENRKITGTNEQTTVANLTQTSEFYSSKLTTIKLEQIKRSKNIGNLKDEVINLHNQIKNYTSIREYPKGEILVKIDSKNNSKVNFELSYLVSNAGWYPSYDIRAKDINEPLNLTYKANVKQDTKVDWKDVRLKFSSAEPSTSGVAPELKPYFLNYHSIPPRYDTSSALAAGKVGGVVTDDFGEALPGVSILVKGTTIGTESDFDGNFELALPKDAKSLQLSYIGYITQEVPIVSNFVNVYMEADEQSLDEVVVVGYGTQRSNGLSGSVSGVSTTSKRKVKESSIAIPFEAETNQTTLEFEIKTPYSVLSDNKNYTVEMTSYLLDSEYQYYSVPKVDPSAFLLAYIKGWEQYNLLEGEATIFFEDTFVGKSILDTRHAGDTLQISLGRDKSVSVKREKVKDFTSKKFVGTRKEESREWKMEIRNSKNQSINMVVYDQIPVSTLDEIKIELIENSKAKLNEENGELKWEFQLRENDSKSIRLKYLVKYPKNRSLVIE